LSLVTRLLGIPLGLAAGFMIGWAQGVSSLIDAISNVASTRIGSTPGLDPYTVQLMSAYVFQGMAQRFNANYGSYWAFGVVLAIGSLVLIGRGDHKAQAGDPEREGPLEQQAPLLKGDSM
jgi:hypothetical protein